MDNLQTFYLRRLESAFEHALHGDVDFCLDKCFELRLKSDLSLYIRSLVNVTIANLTRIQEHPDKLKFAEEAHRLACELNEEEALNALMKEECSRLEQNTAATLREVQTEDEHYKHEWSVYQRLMRENNQAADIAEVMGGLHLDELAEAIEVSETTKEAEEEMSVIEPWNIEGALTNQVPTSMLVHRSHHKPENGSQTSEDHESFLPTHPKPGPKDDDRSQLPTPVASEL